MFGAFLILCDIPPPETFDTQTIALLNIKSRYK